MKTILVQEHTAAKDQIPQQTDTLRPGKTRVYPSMLAEKQVPVLDLTNSTITSEADLQTAFHSLNLCSMAKEDPHMAESNSPQKKTPIDYISDSESSDEEINQLESPLLSSLAANDSGPPQVNYDTEQPRQLQPLQERYSPQTHTDRLFQV